MISFLLPPFFSLPGDSAVGREEWNRNSFLGHSAAFRASILAWIIGANTVSVSLMSADFSGIWSNKLVITAWDSLTLTRKPSSMLPTSGPTINCGWASARSAWYRWSALVQVTKPAGIADSSAPPSRGRKSNSTLSCSQRSLTTTPDAVIGDVSHEDEGKSPGELAVLAVIYSGQEFVRAQGELWTIVSIHISRMLKTLGVGWGTSLMTAAKSSTGSFTLPWGTAWRGTYMVCSDCSSEGQVARGQWHTAKPPLGAALPAAWWQLPGPLSLPHVRWTWGSIGCASDVSGACVPLVIHQEVGGDQGWHLAPYSSNRWLGTPVVPVILSNLGRAWDGIKVQALRR